MKSLLGHIDAKNYAAQAASHGRRIVEGLRQSRDIDGAGRIAEQLLLLEKAVHFAIPNGGSILADNLRGIIGAEIRLPFPVISVEYAVPHPKENDQPKNGEIYFPKIVALAREISMADLKAAFEKEPQVNISTMINAAQSDYFIQVTGFYGYPDNSWIVNPVSVIISSKWDDDYTERANVPINRLEDYVDKKRLNKDAPSYTGTPVVLSEYVMDVAITTFGKSPKETLAHFTSDATAEVASVLELCEALSCKNVYSGVYQRASWRNEKKIAKGKIPIWETKTLVVDTQEPAISSVDRQVYTSGRASPRQHLRRGHIRRLPTGNVWVNSCVVSPGGQGGIQKDYAVM